jgi:transglutaminase-like putative cysteine protease
MIKERVAFAQLPGICACLALVLAPLYASLPLWILIMAGACIALRLLLAMREREAPPRLLMYGLTFISVLLVFLKFRTFNGLAAGSSLLALASGLKLLETRTRRDIYIVSLGIYFLSLASLLQSESFWLLTYIIAVAWCTTVALLRATTRAPVMPLRDSARYGVRLFLQALPLAVIFWLLFPRLNTPLWSLPGGSNAETGLSDSMSPGDITELAQSDEIAFRVHFKGQAPVPRDQYWRGPVLHEFDGRSWKRATYQPDISGAPPEGNGPLYVYTINLEPHPHNWVYALDWPIRYDLQRGSLTTDYTLSQPFPVDRPIDVNITSRTGTPLPTPPSKLERLRDLRSGTSNPRTRELAKELRAAHADDWDLVLGVLQIFSKQAFYYTLTPPPLGNDSVDGFLFDTKRGFCGHYASAFAVLMRDAGVPTRVVTGYQGGTYNRFGNYWIVRQREAHAWDEVWIAGRGWVRVDPTSVIDASRVEQSINDEVAADEPLSSHWQGGWRWLRTARLRLDDLSQLWREQFLTFNQDSQERLLQALHIPAPTLEKLVLLLTGMLALTFLWLTWQVRRELHPAPKDRAMRGYLRFCAKLASAGLPRAQHEGALDLAARIARLRPELAAEVSGIAAKYVALRYGEGSATLADFESAVRAFKPARA